MNAESVLSLGRHALEILLLVSAPLLLSTLVVGLLISIFQAATQINEMTLSFIPKLVAMFLVIIVAGPWMLSVMVDYLKEILLNLPGVIG